MPGSLISFNIGFIKVNNMSGSSSFVVGDAVFPGTQSETKNFVTGAFNTGDAAPMNTPNTPFFYDPDLVDTSSLKQFTGT